MMNELNTICEVYAENERRGLRSALASIVYTTGSTYRRTGARMLIAEDGRTAGSISGGCLEADAVERARQVMMAGTPLVVSYDTRSSEDIIWGLGLGCQGLVEVLIEPLTASSAAMLRRAASAEAPVILATVVGAESQARASVGERCLLTASGLQANAFADAAFAALVEEDARQTLAAGKSEMKLYGEPGAEIKLLLEVIAPPIPLLIFGAGADALPLARLGRELGWRVTVVDTRARAATRERFAEAHEIILCRAEEVESRVSIGPRTAAVVMSHNYLDDLALLATLHRSAARYIGVLGPKKRMERLLTELHEQDSDALRLEDPRLHAPIGLDIGADTPVEIALSILAEIRAVFAGREGSFLKRRVVPIHDAPAHVSPVVGQMLNLGTRELMSAAPVCAV